MAVYSTLNSLLHTESLHRRGDSVILQAETHGHTLTWYSFSNICTHCLMLPFLSQNLCIELLSTVTEVRRWSKEILARSNALDHHLHSFAHHLSQGKATILSPLSLADLGHHNNYSQELAFRFQCQCDLVRTGAIYVMKNSLFILWIL